MKKTTTKMMSGGKATAKKMSGGKTYKMGGKTTPKKKMQDGGSERAAGALGGNCPKGGKCAPGTGPKKGGFIQRVKNMVNPGRIKTKRV